MSKLVESPRRDPCFLETDTPTGCCGIVGYKHLHGPASELNKAITNDIHCTRDPNLRDERNFPTLAMITLNEHQAIKMLPIEDLKSLGWEVVKEFKNGNTGNLVHVLVKEFPMRDVDIDTMYDDYCDDGEYYDE